MGGSDPITSRKRLSAAHFALLQLSRLQAVPSYLTASSKSFIDWVKANIASPEKVPQALRPTLATQKRYVDWGEPWIFGFPDGREREFFKSLGLDIGELLPQDGPEARRPLSYTP